MKVKVSTIVRIDDEIAKNYTEDEIVEKIREDVMAYADDGFEFEFIEEREKPDDTEGE